LENQPVFLETSIEASIFNPAAPHFCGKPGIENKKTAKRPKMQIFFTRRRAGGRR
jgi:hypothetical protein